MKQKAVFYHAGCPVCVSAGQSVLGALDTSRFEVEVVHLGTAKGRLSEAETLGIKSVPALALNGQVFHINFGASLADLK
ncbi:conjugal transfer protein TraF [bacterium]|nr:conjugal transfer protein TraF [bacterium]